MFYLWFFWRSSVCKSRWHTWNGDMRRERSESSILSRDSPSLEWPLRILSLQTRGTRGPPRQMAALDPGGKLRTGYRDNYPKTDARVCLSSSGSLILRIVRRTWRCRITHRKRFSTKLTFCGWLRATVWLNPLADMFSISGLRNETNIYLVNNYYRLIISFVTFFVGTLFTDFNLVIFSSLFRNYVLCTLPIPYISYLWIRSFFIIWKMCFGRDVSM